MDPDIWGRGKGIMLNQVSTLPTPHPNLTPNFKEIKDPTPHPTLATPATPQGRMYSKLQPFVPPFGGTMKSNSEPLMEKSRSKCAFSKIFCLFPKFFHISRVNSFLRPIFSDSPQNFTWI